MKSAFGTGFGCFSQCSRLGVQEQFLSSPLQRLIHFHQQYGFFQDPNLLLGKTPIKVVKEAKFLGPIFDTKLTFKKHVQYLKSFCQKALDILRVVAHTDWGASRIVLLRLYRALVRSKLDYGCIIYGSARRSVLKNPIHPQGLHISCPKSQRSRTVPDLSLSKICFKLCSQIKISTGKSSLQLRFRTRKRQTI